MTARLAALRVSLGILGAATALACATPARPYGQPDFVLEQVPTFVDSAVRAPAMPRLLVLGALEDHTVQPVGGQYNEEEYRVSPLLRTFYYWALAPKVLDELHAGLRERGARVVKEYLDSGAPAPFPSPPYPPGLLVLRGSIESFGLARQVHGGDVLIAELDLRLLRGESGELLWRGRPRVAFRSAWAHDPFRRLGQAVSAGLLGDRAFRVAIGGAP